MEQPLLSIITPVLNGARHLEQTINSVLDQSYCNTEYILIDGGSTDGSLDIIKKYQDHVTYWESCPDRGISDAFNKGIKKASGKIIGIINSDDWYEPHTLKIVADYYRCNQEFDIFYGKIKFITQHSFRIYPCHPLAHVHLFQYMSLGHPSVFAKKEAYKTFGLFKLKYKLALDYEFLLRALILGAKYKFIDSLLSNFRTGGISTRHFLEAQQECRLIRRELFSKYDLI